jgi:cytochrome P450
LTDLVDFDIGLRNVHFAPLLGDGIFTQAAPAWKHSRDTMRPPLMSSRHANFDKIKSSVEKLLEKVPADGLVDLQPLFFDLTLETAMFLLFADAAPSHESIEGQTRQTVFADAFTSAQEYLSYRSRLGNFYWLVDTSRFRRACDTTRAFIEDAVQRARTPEERGSSFSFIDTLLQKTKDKAILRDQCVNVLLAGRDTTACCLSWTM